MAIGSGASALDLARFGRLRNRDQLLARQIGAGKERGGRCSVRDDRHRGRRRSKDLDRERRGGQFARVGTRRRMGVGFGDGGRKLISRQTG